MYLSIILLSVSWPVGVYRAMSPRASGEVFAGSCVATGKKGAPETRHPVASGPFGERRQAHQDRVDIAAGLETEQSPAVVDEVEFGVAPAPDQLRVALGLGEGQAHAAAHDLREDVEERLADRLRDRKSTRLNSSH